MIRIFPEDWGPSLWQSMEHIALHYPVDPSIEEKEWYLNFFNSLVWTIPCDECAEHYLENIKKNPPKMNNRFELVSWLIQIHNEVNIKNDKPRFTLNDFLFKYNLILRDLFE